MAEPKTKPTGASVKAFLDAKVKDAARRADCEAVLALMQDVTKAPPVMWGTSIVGFGAYNYKYARGGQADWPLTGFSPRATQLVLYVMPGCEGYDAMMAALGPVKCGVSCIYLKRLSDVPLPALKRLIKASVAHVKKTSGATR
ncbi:MAG: DUF1801 domain-containing protein [Vicinamibacterales bacterium]